MELEIVRTIFKTYGLGEAQAIKKIEIGFTNEVFSVDDHSILKVCENENDEAGFCKEIFLLEKFSDEAVVPTIRVFDRSKKIYGKIFSVLGKIEGENLYSKWHLLNEPQRKSFVEQICLILKKISSSPYREYSVKFNEPSPFDWKRKIASRIYGSLETVVKTAALSPDFTHAIQKFVEENIKYLREQKVGLVHADPHFDNVLVRADKVVGFLDFERTELASIDYNLDVFKRMMEYPDKYLSKEFKKFARREDYENLFVWVREIYPQLFEFENLSERLDLYDLEHGLGDLVNWPDSIWVKQRVANSIHYQGVP